MTDASASQYDAYASATTNKYSIQANEDVTLSYGEDGTTVSGYTINGVKNVSVKVSAETYVQAAILKAASALPGTGVYAEAAGITLNADPAAAVAQYKTLNSDGTYSATTFNTVATVTTATAILETSSRWGDYVLEVTETDATKYIRTGRTDDGFAVDSTILKPTLTGGLTGKITYTSSNKKVATVNKNGKITAKNKTGYAKITIKCGSYKKVVKVYVNEKLTLKKSSATIKVKGKTTIKATTNIKGTITYTSSDTKVATVSKKGVVKGVKKGTATITVECNGKTKKFKVKVK